MISQNIFNNLHMILNSWNKVIEDVAFTFQAMYICIMSCLRLFSEIFDNSNRSSLHLLTMYSSMYSFRCSSLPITAYKCLCPGDVIFMLVLSNIFAAFDSYSALTIDIVLLGFGKYSYFGPTSEKIFHQLRNFANLPELVKSLAKATILGSLSG